MIDQLNRLRNFESALSIAKQDLATFEATETTFCDYAGQSYRQNPSEATGLTHHTTPYPHITSSRQSNDRFNHANDDQH